MDKRAVIALAGRTFGFDTQPFEKLLDLREERIKPRDYDAGAHLAAYLQGIEAVIGAVDRFAKK